MKKHIITFCLILTAAATLWAQTPNVNITVDEITTTSYTATFHPTDCTQYHIYSDVVGGMDMWIMMMGSVENIISAWGIHCTSDTTHTWTEMQPGTDYVIYALAVNGDNAILYTDTIRTLSAGGSGESVITLSVENITDNSVRTISEPNDQTLLFKDFLIEKASFDTLDIDTVINWLKDDPYVHYETDIWEWLSLKTGTPYYLCAIGMNGDSVWGEMSKLEFSTTGEPLSITENNERNIKVYPNPASNYVTIENLSAQSRIVLTDMQGKQIETLNASNTNLTINTTNLSRGSYLIQIFNSPATAPIVKTLILQ